MASANRKLRRNRLLKKRKDSKGTLKQALNATAGLPTNCSFCDTEFDSDRDSDSWIVEFKKSGKVRLLCPKCT